MNRSQRLAEAAVQLGLMRLARMLFKDNPVSALDLHLFALDRFTRYVAGGRTGG